ncbi:hypothetical protein EC988_004901 [Linderina pennispora]|nr:hypothetical protein EC988_004901 [Linderina pennispora]
MSNSRFKGLGKLGKSVDKIYSNMQKEKLEDTTVYVASLQRLFEAVMQLEGVLHYFARLASDSETVGWFVDNLQSPAGFVNPHYLNNDSNSELNRSHTHLATTPSSPPQPSLSSSHDESLAAGRHQASDRKSRRRSNYFTSPPHVHRQGSTQTPEVADSSTSVFEGKPRGNSISSIPRLVPPVLGNSSANARFVLPASAIKTPMSLVSQGKGRAPGVIYARLIRVAEWLNQVLLAWVVRDIQVLFAKYIKRLREWVVE